MSITTLIVLLIKVSIMLSVFAIGLKATFSDTTYFLTRPAQLARALLSMNVLMPLFAVAACLAFPLHPAVKVALLVLSISPVPPILPKRALKAGGDEDYTIGLLVTAGLLSIVLIPLSMEVIERLVGLELSMSFGALIKLVLSTVLFPLLAGILFRVVAVHNADRLARPLGLVAMFILIVSALPILIVSTRAFLTLAGDGTLIALSAFAIVGFIVGHLCGGPEPENRPVLALATASRHPAIAMAIAHANFPDQKLAPACVLIYLILNAVLAAPYLNWTRRSRPLDTHTKEQVEA